jgi:hypothetical protein
MLDLDQVARYRAQAFPTRHRRTRRLDALLIVLVLGVALATPLAASAEQIDPVKGGGDLRASERFMGTAPSIAFPAAATKAAMGFGGATPQGRPLSLQVSGDGASVTKLLVSWGARCTDGDTVGITSAVRNFPIRRGSFTKTQKESQPQADGSVWTFENAVSGSLSTKAASGKLRMVLTGVQGGQVMFRCDTGALQWKVPRAYAGETSQRQPFALQTRQGNREVTGAVLAWTARCTSGSFGQAGRVILEDGDVDARGRFLANSISRMDVGGGFAAMLDQGIDGGILTPTKVTATWRALAIIVNTATGEQVDSCRTGPLKMTGVR